MSRSLRPESLGGGFGDGCSTETKRCRRPAGKLTGVVPSRHVDVPGADRPGHVQRCDHPHRRLHGLRRHECATARRRTARPRCAPEPGEEHLELRLERVGGECGRRDPRRVREPHLAAADRDAKRQRARDGSRIERRARCEHPLAGVEPGPDDRRGAQSRRRLRAVSGRDVRQRRADREVVVARLRDDEPLRGGDGERRSLRVDRDSDARRRVDVVAHSLRGRRRSRAERRRRRERGERGGERGEPRLRRRRGRRSGERDGRRQAEPGRTRHRIWLTVGKVFESGSSCDGRVRHVVEAREVDVVVDDAFVVVQVEAALVAVRALHRHLVQRLGDLRGLRRAGMQDRRGDQVDEVVRVHRRLRRLDHLVAGLRLHADAVDAVGALELLLERLERAGADLGGQAPARERQAVDPVRMVGELLADERVGAGRRGVDRDVPAGRSRGGDRRGDRRGPAPDEQRCRVRAPRAQHLRRDVERVGRHRVVARDRRLVARERGAQRFLTGGAVLRVVVESAIFRPFGIRYSASLNAIP